MPKARSFPSAPSLVTTDPSRRLARKERRWGRGYLRITSCVRRVIWRFRVFTMRGGASNGEGERAMRPQTARRTANLAGRGRCNMIYHVECGPSSLFSPRWVFSLFSSGQRAPKRARARALFVSPLLLMKWRTSICHSWLGRDNHERVSVGNMDSQLRMLRCRTRATSRMR